MYNTPGRGNLFLLPYKNKKIMKRYKGYEPTQIVRHLTEEGQSIEEKIRQVLAGNEPIEETAPMIYTEKAAGVQPEFDIRTDRQELALDATDKFSKSIRMSTDEKPTEEPKVEQPKSE